MPKFLACYQKKNIHMKVKGIVIQGIKAEMSENSTISSLEKYGTYEIYVSVCSKSRVNKFLL